jgi:hypothetical protein
MLIQLVETILTYLNASGYYKSAEEIKNAINITQIDLYKRLRGNLAQYAPGRPSSSVYPEVTTATSDAIAELYDSIGGIVPTNNIVDLSVPNYPRVIDLVLSLEVTYLDNSGTFYPVNIVPDNQFLMMSNNPVVPPVKTRPLGRLHNLYQYEIAPAANVKEVRARVLTLPNPIDFRFEESDGPLPIIVPGVVPLDWTDEKIDNLLYGTIASLGFNLSNGVLVQSGTAMNEKIL